MFSTITTDPSTTIPKSIAPRLIRLAARPNSRIPMKAKSIDSGITLATIRAPRTSPSSPSRTAMTRKPPCTRFSVTVSVVRSTRSAWS